MGWEYGIWKVCTERSRLGGRPIQLGVGVAYRQVVACRRHSVGGDWNILDCELNISKPKT